MQRTKTFRIGFGTIISLIIAYFIYLYASEKGWKFLAFISKAYLLVYLAIFGIIIAIIFLAFLLVFWLFRPGKYKIYSFKPKQKPKKDRKEKSYIDVDYNIKE